MVEFNKTALRRKAEGLPLSLKWGQIEEIARKEQFELNPKYPVYTPEEVDEEFVISILRSAEYGPGYLYRTRVSYPDHWVIPEAGREYRPASGPWEDASPEFMEATEEAITTAKVGEGFLFEQGTGNGTFSAEYKLTEKGWCVLTLCDPEDEWWAEESHKQVWPLFPGIREVIAKHFGSQLSSEFHRLFDEAVESRYN